MEIDRQNAIEKQSKQFNRKHRVMQIFKIIISRFFQQEKD